MAAYPPVPRTNNGANMNMATWVGTYESWANQMMSLGYKLNDIISMVKQAGETWPKNLTASITSKNTLFPGADMLYRYDLDNHMKQSYDHNNADGHVGAGEWVPMDASEVDAANKYYAWRENPANAGVIAQYGDNPYNAYVAATHGGAIGVSPQGQSVYSGPAVSASSGASAQSGSTAKGVTDWYVKKPDGTIVTRASLGANFDLSGALSQGYQSLKNQTLYPNGNGTFSSTPPAGGGVSAASSSTPVNPNNPAGSANVSQSQLDALVNSLTQGASLDTASQTFNLNRALQQYASGVPIQNFLTDLYGQVLGVGFTRPNTSIGSYIPSGPVSGNGTGSPNGAGIGIAGPTGDASPDRNRGGGVNTGGGDQGNGGGGTTGPAGGGTGGGGGAGGSHGPNGGGFGHDPANDPPDNSGDQHQNPDDNDPGSVNGDPGSGGNGGDFGEAPPDDPNDPGSGGGKAAGTGGAVNSGLSLTQLLSTLGIGTGSGTMVSNSGATAGQHDSGTTQPVVQYDPNATTSIPWSENPANPYVSDPWWNGTYGTNGPPSGTSVSHPNGTAGTFSDVSGPMTPGNGTGVVNSGLNLTAPPVNQSNPGGVANPGAPVTGSYYKLANSFNPNNPTTWGLLGAPASQIAGGLDDAKRNIMMNMPAGGERDKAMGDAVNQGYGQLAGLKQGLVNQSLSGLGQISQSSIYGQPTQQSNSAGNLSSLLGNQNQYNLGLQQLTAGEKNSSNSMWGSILGAIGGAAATALLSDIRAKEDVKPFTRGLSDLAKIKAYSYDYNGWGGSTKGEPGISLMAQDLEKAIPEAVVDGDVKHIVPMGLLMTAINSINELNRKVVKLSKKEKK